MSVALAPDPSRFSPVKEGVALSLNDLTVAYDRHPIVHHFSGSFAVGSLTAIVGPNGAGKSSLLKAIAGLLPPRAGSIDRKGLSKHDIAFLPQAVEVDRTFPLSVIDIVDFGHWKKVGAFGSISAKRQQKSKEALAAVGLAGSEAVPISHLSIGQLQRVLFARLIVQDAALILLDEPLNAVDATTIERMMTIILKWHEEGRTILAALHDLDLVRHYFPETLLMARELVAWGKTESVLSEKNLTRANLLAKRWSDPAEICRYPASSYPYVV